MGQITRDGSTCQQGLSGTAFLFASITHFMHDYQRALDLVTIVDKCLMVVNPMRLALVWFLLFL